MSRLGNKLNFFCSATVCFWDHPQGHHDINNFFWKFNNSLLEDPLFVQSLREKFPNWLQEINFCDDIRVKWDWMKYKIRQDSIMYSKSKAKQRRKKLQTIENKLKMCENDLAKSPSQENVATLEALKAEYERPEIGTLLVDSLNYAYSHGELSITQKQAIITLIEKKDKDRRLIKNWRPISLLNVDVKIGSKAIAKRLEKVLPHIIHYDQNAFVKGRTIFDATRTISDVMDFTKARDYKGIMTAIDFEKAFDSVNWNFLSKALESFGFGESFRAWIKTFYNNISSSVTNNGFSTPSFNLKRGVRQGDPLSPSLFIIVLELLAISVRNDNQIRGIKIDGNELKLVIFADDMTFFVRDTRSHLTLINTINLFSTYSGLCINHDKTEILLLGNMEIKASELGVKEIRKVVKILGVHFTHDHYLFYKMNFQTIEKSLRESLKGWSWRGLTLLGRIQVIKSFAIPKILYRASLISTKKDFIKKINNLLYSFVWKGKDKVKRNALINSLEQGGLKMPDIESMIKAQRVLCIKKFIETNPAGWKLFLGFYLKR